VRTTGIRTSATIKAVNSGATREAYEERSDSGM
jgi:hypothetical protein